MCNLFKGPSLTPIHYLVGLAVITKVTTGGMNVTDGLSERNL